MLIVNYLVKPALTFGAGAVLVGVLTGRAVGGAHERLRQPGAREERRRHPEERQEGGPRGPRGQLRRGRVQLQRQRTLQHHPAPRTRYLDYRPPPHGRILCARGPNSPRPRADRPRPRQSQTGACTRHRTNRRIESGPPHDSTTRCLHRTRVPASGRPQVLTPTRRPRH